MKMRLNSQRYVLKIDSLTLKNNNWNYNVSLEDARKREELIAVGSSQCLRFILDIKKYEFTDDYITKPFKPSLLYAKCLALLKRNKKIKKI